MKKNLIVGLLILASIFCSCTIKRYSVDKMFPIMSYLEVYNGGTCIGQYEGNIQVKMGSMCNTNIYGHDFILEYYEVYVNGKYVESFIDSDAMAFKYK